jgi:hypothetical protein
MNNEILWLVRLGLDQNLFTCAQALAVRDALGPNAELMDFAQKLIVSDHETLEKEVALANISNRVLRARIT